MIKICIVFENSQTPTKVKEMKKILLDLANLNIVMPGFKIMN